MSIVCIESERSSSSDPRKIRKLLQLHKLLPNPGFGYGDTDDSLVDFTDPNLIKYFIAGRFDGSLQTTSGESSKDRFPLRNCMTNFWRWQDDYSMCLSLGVIWVLNWTNLTWSVVKIQDSRGSELTFPDDMLVSVKGDPDSMRLIRFMHIREDCTHVVKRTFTFSLQNQSIGRNLSDSGSQNESSTDLSNYASKSRISARKW